MLNPRRITVDHLNTPYRVCILIFKSCSETTTKIMLYKNDVLWVSITAFVSEQPVHVFCLSSVRMSGQKRPSEAGGPSSGPPEKRRERDGGEDAGPGLSAAAGGSTAVETVIKLGLNANTVRRITIEVRICPISPWATPTSTPHVMFETSLLRRNKTSKLCKLKTASWEKPLIKDR